MFIDFYEEFYFIRKLINDGLYIGEGSDAWKRGVNKYFFENHYNFLIYILIYIIKIVKHDKSVISRSGSTSGSISSWEKKKDYINFIKELLFTLEQESITGVYDVTSNNVKPLFESLYKYIGKFKDEDKIKISNTHISVCITELERMINEKREESNKKSSSLNRFSNTSIKRQKVLGGTKKKKYKKKDKKSKSKTKKANQRYN